ncbi:MAG TPA: hypothetical protein DCW90_17935 [Lachnospiraceae bacterium]|nr:hypothetical protein [Lachnospiraceae bacterium]
MAHIRFLGSGFDKTTGEAWVKKSSPYGVFTGWANCSNEDLDIQSEFIGCSIAEYRADVQIANARRKWLRQRYEGIKNLNNTILNNWDSRMLEANNKGHYEVSNMFMDMRIQEDEAKKLSDKAWIEWKEMVESEWLVIDNLLYRKRKYQDK